MVFIVKIPSRSRANTPEASSSTPVSEQPPSSTSIPQIAAPSSSATLSTAAVHTTSIPGSPSTSMSQQDKPTPSSSTPPPPPKAADLDILLAPSVLNHRYVRGVDKSLIVERPERIRAVLLGIASAIGKTGQDQHPPLPSSSVASTPPPKPTPHDAGVSGNHTEDDDLIAKLGSLSMHNHTKDPDTALCNAPQRFRILHSNRSVPLDVSHPAVDFVHAHSQEMVTVLESAYEKAKQKRRNTQSSSPSLDIPIKQEQEREATPTPASTSQSDPQHQAGSPPASTFKETSHAAYLAYLCSKAPSQPPQSRSQHNKTQSPSTSSKFDDSEAYTSSDGEGDDAMHLSEIPDHLPQGDLYLAGPSDDQHNGGSAEAISQAMGACCEAVDRVVAASVATSSASPPPTTISPLPEIRYDPAVFQPSSTATSESTSTTSAPSKRAFVLSRPPGHHCSGSTPSGFCWVNNAVVASAHAYLKHAVDRVVILDIDLHHGNGTQALAWRINSDANKHDDQRAEQIASLRHAALDRLRGTPGRGHAHRGAKVSLSESEEQEIRRQAGNRALRLFYGSIHDIESFPCEDGDPTLIKDASVCVEGAHGQWIWNIHLDHYSNDADFARLYASKYSALFAKAEHFLRSTQANPQSTLILISAGFDACSYEYPGMQRHGKSVPPSFYHTFARDSVQFANRWAAGKLISVLEGGYSDRALCSAALAHVTGLASQPESEKDENEFWKLDNLIAVEKVAKKMAAHAAAADSATTQGNGGLSTTPKRRQAELPPWLSLTSRAFAAFERACGKTNMVPLGMATSSGSGRSSAATSVVNSPSVTVGGGGGRVLRDRGALKPSSRNAFDTGGVSTPTASQNTTPTARKKVSPTKKESPIKKEKEKQSQSPSKKTLPYQTKEASPQHSPIKMEEASQDRIEDMQMDTPTRKPLHASAVTHSSAPLSSADVPLSPDASSAMPPDPSATAKSVQMQSQPHAQPAAPPQPSVLPPYAGGPTTPEREPSRSIAESFQSRSIDNTTGTLAPANATNAPSRLVDAMSSIKIGEAPAAQRPHPMSETVSRSANLATQSITNYDATTATSTPMRDDIGDELDAPGSPDPTFAAFSAARHADYDQSVMPGGLAELHQGQERNTWHSDLSTPFVVAALKHQIPAEQDDDGKRGLYPALPALAQFQFQSQTQGQQQNEQSHRQ